MRYRLYRKGHPDWQQSATSGIWSDVMSNAAFILTDPQEVLEKNWDSAYEVTRSLAGAESRQIAEKITAAVQELLSKNGTKPLKSQEIYEVARRLLESQA